jgi:hypothetical protein
MFVRFKRVILLVVELRVKSKRKLRDLECAFWFSLSQHGRFSFTYVLDEEQISKAVFPFRVNRVIVFVRFDLFRRSADFLFVLFCLLAQEIHHAYLFVFHLIFPILNLNLIKTKNLFISVWLK